MKRIFFRVLLASSASIWASTLPASFRSGIRDPEASVVGRVARLIADQLDPTVIIRQIIIAGRTFIVKLLNPNHALKSCVEGFGVWGMG